MAKVMTKRTEIIDFLRRHPTWFLEQCQGSTMNSEWWWVRNSRAMNKTIKCNGNAARAATRRLLLNDGRWFLIGWED